MRRGDRWPRSLIVPGKGRWRVRLVSQRALKGALGDYHPDRRTIRVWVGLRGEARWRVLLHEILHIAFGLAHGQSGVSIGLEETLIEALSTGPEVSLYDILRDNFGFGPVAD